MQEMVNDSAQMMHYEVAILLRQIVDMQKAPKEFFSFPEFPLLAT
ncbi:hypothetical protein [Desulfopila sp. IMCC35008]|nr:hypothetical protein [Desulfopila sp. IMCC35008]